MPLAPTQEPEISLPVQSLYVLLPESVNGYSQLGVAVLTDALEEKLPEKDLINKGKTNTQSPGGNYNMDMVFSPALSHSWAAFINYTNVSLCELENPVSVC